MILKTFPRTVACGVALLLLAHASQTFAANPEARTTYCDSTHPAVHVSGNLVWCADPTFWSQHSSQVQPYYSWGDQLIPTIEKNFGLSSSDTFYIVIDAPNGGASTPTPYGPGINITGDAFYDTAYNVYGFWAYLLITHEFINQWTGLVTAGWPTDWWADHRSPFPNSMDAFVLAQLGQNQAAAAQSARFQPGGDSADPEVVMFNNFMNNYGQWGFVQRLVQYMRGDGMQWTNLRDPPNYNTQTTFVSGNPSALLADYVTAYLSLSAAQDVTAQVSAAGVGQQPPSWPSGTPFTPYTVDGTQVGLIADAHCAVNAARAQGSANNSRALQLLQIGNYQGALNAVAGGYSCGNGCPTTECGCSSSNTCVAAFHAGTANPPKPPTTTGGPITLAENTSYCLDLSAGNTTNGTALQTWGCNNTSSQAVSYTGGTLQVDGKCVQAASSNSAAALQIHDCNGSALQQWVVSGQAITLANTSLCIDVPSNQPANGRTLWVYSCNSTAAQKWNVSGVSTSTLRTSSNTGYCLDVRHSGTADGTPVQIWPCNGTAAQSWSVGGGRLSALGRCLAVSNAAGGTKVELLQCTEANKLSWAVNGETVALAGTGLCLDLPGNQVSQGAQVQVWGCNNTAAQQWVPQY